MALKTFKSYTKSSRGTILVDRKNIWKGKPLKSLTFGKISSGGRNNLGRITSRSKGAGHKNKYRAVDFYRKKDDIKATVERIEYDPNRSGYLALIKYEDGLRNYILAPSKLKIGDEVIVHHNVFRRWYNKEGEEKVSFSYIKKDLYHVNEDQIYLYKKNNNWFAYNGYTFIKPILNKDKFTLKIENQNKGIVKYTDGVFNVGELVGFNPRVNHEFIIDDELLYKIPNNFIEIIYEYQGNEETYNPSWA